MATLADINARLTRLDIKGKPYATVAAKVIGFRELYPDGRIVTEKLSDDGERCDFRAEAWDGERLLATGHAFEFRGGGMVNKTSYVENCETSAVGRALAFLGIGADESIASAEEVMSAIAQQEAEKSKPAPKSRKKAQKAAEGDTAPVVIDVDEAKLAEAKRNLFRAMRGYAERMGRDVDEIVKATFSERPPEQWTVEEFEAKAYDFYEGA